MTQSLVRSRAMITRTLSATEWEEIPDGAVLQEDGIITAVGTYDDLHRKHPTVPVVIFRLLGHPGALNYGMALAASVVLAATTALVVLAVERLRVPSLGAM